MSRYFRRKAWDEERARELEAHLAHEMDENRERGLSEEEARRRAYVRLGNPRTIREEIWEMNSVTWVENLGRDVRYAMRQLRRSPGFTAIAIVTLALGIGVNTAIFSVVNGLLFSSLHVRQQDRVVQIALRQKDTDWNANMSVPELRTIQQQTKGVFSAVIGGQYGLDGLSMAGHRPDRALTYYVTGNYFGALGVRPYLGRFFRASEGTVPGADPEVVLNYAYWKDH
ncbi:MAG: permease prefix domain 1-containing protein, partial [Acidobacteriota bacterium]